MKERQETPEQVAELVSMVMEDLEEMVLRVATRRFHQAIADGRSEERAVQMVSAYLAQFSQREVVAL